MQNNRIILIGGCGYVGYHLANALLKRDFMILILDVAPLPSELLCSSDILYQRYDILLDDHLDKILKGFKPAVIVSIVGWGMSGTDMLKEKCFWVNVEGTENVLKACLKCNINKFIYTSTYNVCFHGKTIENGNEELPYSKVEDFLDKYSASKVIAEKKVIESNGKLMNNGRPLMTAAIRPAAIYGENEQRHLPRILKHIDSGLFLFRIGRAKVDWVHVNNLVRIV
jgi:nucleoside-diphosphate-sugar epimerase